jgi:glycosyltransferase involved in cell wall biosynthesis
LVECGDAAAVAEAIGWFLRLDSEALRRLMQNARDKAEQVFDVRKQSQALLRYYHEVLVGFERTREAIVPVLGAQS